MMNYSFQWLIEYLFEIGIALILVLGQFGSAFLRG